MDKLQSCTDGAALSLRKNTSKYFKKMLNSGVFEGGLAIWN